MEWWKLFSGTFILIFLAELGDKTQLAAMAKTADSPDNSMAKWVVFGAASLALASSTFIAVFLGGALKSIVPDERYIKIAAGSLFVIFGAVILHDVYRSFQARPEPAGAAREADPAAAGDKPPGVMGGLALRAAMDFEAFAGKRYRRLAAAAPDGLSGLLFELAAEEDGHLARLRGLPEKAGDAGAGDAAIPEAGTSGAAAPETVAELVRHETAMAEFYLALANRASIPPVRTAFARLADEERGHAARLSGMERRLGHRPRPQENLHG